MDVERRSSRLASKRRAQQQEPDSSASPSSAASDGSEDEREDDEALAPSSPRAAAPAPTGDADGGGGGAANAGAADELSPLHGEGLLQLLQAARQDCARGLPIGTRVWAKVRGFTEWPGVTWCITLVRRTQLPGLLRAYSPGSKLVCFHGEHTLAWVPPAALLRAAPPISQGFYNSAGGAPPGVRRDGPAAAAAPQEGAADTEGARADGDAAVVAAAAAQPSGHAEPPGVEGEGGGGGDGGAAGAAATGGELEVPAELESVVTRRHNGLLVKLREWGRKMGRWAAVCWAFAFGVATWCGKVAEQGGGFPASFSARDALLMRCPCRRSRRRPKQVAAAMWELDGCLEEGESRTEPFLKRLPRCDQPR